MSVTLNGTSGLVFGDGTIQGTAAGMPFRNRIINGDMRIDQRRNGGSVTSGALQYTVDRWRELAAPTSKFTIQRNAGSVTPPAGFTNYLGLTSTSAYSVAAADYQIIQQFIEGLNAADLAWGTSSAKTVTVSFWVRSSLTGLFGGSIQNSSNTRSYPFSYTISAANTWQFQTVTIPGDTTGTWLTDNGRGITLNFSIGVGSNNSGTAGAWAGSDFRSATGSTSVVGTNGATFYLTGVQLEKAAAATDFEFRPYGTELAMCQRYYEKSYPVDVNPGTIYGTGFITGIQAASQYATVSASYKVEKRTVPTVVLYNRNTGTAGQMNADNTNITNPFVTQHPVGLAAHTNGQTTGINQFLNLHFASDSEL